VIKLQKDDVTMTVRDNNHVAAFLNNGWTIKEDGKSEKSDFSNFMNPPAESEKTEETDYTKSAIQHLTTAELKDLAAKEGLADVENKTGGELKKELIEHFNL
jgi:ketopantoate reductase